MKKILLTVSVLSLFISAVQAQGNIAAFVAASATSSNTTGSIIILDPSMSGQTPLNTYPINGAAGTDALRFSGSATSTGYLSNTNDGSLLTFTGANTTTTTGNTNTVLPRGVGTINSAGTFALATTYTGANGNQPRAATSLDNTAYYIADQGGLYTNNATTPSPVGNFRNIRSFGGTVMYQLPAVPLLPYR